LRAVAFVTRPETAPAAALARARALTSSLTHIVPHAGGSGGGGHHGTASFSLLMLSHPCPAQATTAGLLTPSSSLGGRAATAAGASRIGVRAPRATAATIGAAAAAASAAGRARATREPRRSRATPCLPRAARYAPPTGSSTSDLWRAVFFVTFFSIPGPRCIAPPLRRRRGGREERWRAVPTYRRRTASRCPLRASQHDSIVAGPCLAASAYWCGRHHAASGH
jgi:hypothetical protein